MLGLVGDIGGTNVRFGLTELLADGPATATGRPAGMGIQVIPDSIQALVVKEYPTLEEALSDYLQEQGKPALGHGVIAVATPVLQDRLVMTNSHWDFHQSVVSRTFGFERLSFINDFSALAYSLPWLAEDSYRFIGSAGVIEEGSSVKAVAGPGTGFGVSAVVPNGDDWVAIEGEGGHSFLRVTNQREFELRQQLSELLLAQGMTSHVSAERMLSGSGLELTYQALMGVDGKAMEKKSAPEILACGIANNKSVADCYATETLELFCCQLGYCAADFTLTYGAMGGMFIGGGIVPRMADFFAASRFRECFEDKGRVRGMLSDVPTPLIVEPFAALTGAAYVMKTGAGIS